MSYMSFFDHTHHEGIRGGEDAERQVGNTEYHDRSALGAYGEEQGATASREAVVAVGRARISDPQTASSAYPPHECAWPLNLTGRPFMVRHVL